MTAITAPLGSSARTAQLTSQTNQLLAAASAQTGISAPTFATPSQVSKGISSSMNPKDIVGNPADPIQINQGPVPPVATAQPSPSTVNATPTTGAAATTTTPPVNSTPSGLPGAPNLTGSTSQQAGQALDQLKQKYGQALTDITKSGVASPTSAGAANAGISTAIKGQPPAPQQQPTTSPSVDNYFNPETNPAIQQSTQDLLNFLSPPATQNDLNDAMSKVLGDQNTLSAEKVQLMNMQNVMAGSADDIRDEVTAANGFATESQVQAMAVSRNKVLLKQSSQLQSQIQLQQDQVNTDSTLLSFEKDMANTQFTQRMSVMQYQASQETNMQNAARTSLTEMQKTEGWDGVYKAAVASGDPSAIERINSAMGPGFDLKTAAANDTTVAQNNADLAAKQASTANTQANTAKTLADANEAAGVPNPAKANAPGYSANGVKYTVASAAQELQNEIKTQGLMGTAKLLTPGDYNQMKAWWVAQGLTDASFDSEFGGYKDPTRVKAPSQYN